MVKMPVRGSEMLIGGSRGQLERLGGQIDGQEGIQRVCEANRRIKRAAGGSERPTRGMGASQWVWEGSQGVWEASQGVWRVKLWVRTEPVAQRYLMVSGSLALLLFIGLDLHLQSRAAVLIGDIVL